MNEPGPPRRPDHLWVQLARPTTGLAAIVFTAALILVGCADGQDQTGEKQDSAIGSSAPPATTVTVTATETAASSPVESNGNPPSPSGSTSEECSPSTVPVATDAAGIAAPFPDRAWSVWQTGNLCGPLGYAELETAGGTGSSPTQLLLYNEGEFLGTGIRCNALGQVTDSTSDSVTVQYRWPIGSDSNANMRGRTDVTFQWNGSSVDMIGNLPQDAVGTAC
ncbi:LppP/LprE family lipoprotein [Dietzia alimentaria]|uniref:LppP/LprE family lipoprotein n=1 Tax=Dietzia alimentaria TaxID=665550 RepID=UPI00029A69F5|nr:LppP/LprE family lipoprotein [Dietzia alimentaria]